MSSFKAIRTKLLEQDHILAVDDEPKTPMEIPEYAIAVSVLAFSKTHKQRFWCDTIISRELFHELRISTEWLVDNILDRVRRTDDVGPPIAIEQAFNGDCK